jgi:hypothetical protein
MQGGKLKLPIQVVSIDGHIWLQCTHPACRSQSERGKLSRLNNGDNEGNGRKLDEAIAHADKLHGIP